MLSFFLPATNAFEMPTTPPGTPLTGWQTCTSWLTFLAVEPLIIIAQPRSIVVLSFPVIDVAMLAAPFVVLAWDRAWLLSGCFFLFGFLPWLLPTGFLGDMFIGFYLWDVSFFVMGAGCVLAGISRRQAYDRPLPRFEGT